MLLTALSNPRAALALYGLQNMPRCPECSDTASLRSIPHRKDWNVPDACLAFEYGHLTVRITACSLSTDKGVFYNFRTGSADVQPMFEDLYVRAMLEYATPKVAPLTAWAYGYFLPRAAELII